MTEQYSYIIQTDRNMRERHAVRQLFRIDQERMFSMLGLPFFSWWVLDFDTQWFGRKPGDIDILGGPLAWCDSQAFAVMRERVGAQHPDAPVWLLDGETYRVMAIEDQIQWPPVIDYLAGAEAKCAFFKELQPCSAKHTDEDRVSIREQIEGLLLLGLDRVLLIDLIANEPATGQDGAAWMQAAALADASMKAMEGVLRARLSQESSAGHLVMPIGAVVGGDESMRGALAPTVLREPRANPFRHAANDSVQQHRRKLASAVERFLRAQPRPRAFPAVFVTCKVCQPARVHGLDDPECPLTPQRLRLFHAKP